jgi:hypothetical protein
VDEVCPECALHDFTFALRAPAPKSSRCTSS